MTKIEVATQILAAYIISGEYNDKLRERNRYDMMVADAVWMADKLMHEVENEEK